MNYNTLIDVIQHRQMSGDKGITFIETGKGERFLSYQELYNCALRALSCLRTKGLHPGNELVFQIESNETFVVAFWACVLGGIIPVPLSVGKTDDHRQKVFNVWQVLDHPFLLASTEQVKKLQNYADERTHADIYQTMLGGLVSEDDLLQADEPASPIEAQENDLAFVQFSSGSTGTPKGVMLTHKNLLANMQAISEAARYTAADSLLSWMPLTHDMGLIGFHLNPLYSGLDQYLMPTSLFVRRPMTWLEKATEHKVSVLCSPNFGYEYLMKRWSDADHPNLDLSHVRIIYNGAEPISIKVCRQFIERLASFGLKSYALCPVYGLAEASVAVSMSGLNDDIIVASLPVNGVAKQVVNVGKPIEYCRVRITGDDGEVLPGTVGFIEINGANVTSGYYNDQKETNLVLTADDWLRTGDLGFMRDGCLYVTGRSKDLFFVNGQNYYPHDIEYAALELSGIELNRIAITGYYDRAAGREKVAAFIVHKGSIDSFLPIARSLAQFVSQRFGFTLDAVLPVKEIPRTTSGKLQRYKLAELLQLGAFSAVAGELETLIQGSLMNDSLNRTAYEQQLIEIWSRVLGRPVTDINASFTDLGGNSLRFAEMSAYVSDAFGIELPVEGLYTKTTIRHIASAISKQNPKEYQRLIGQEKGTDAPASYSQMALYHFQQLDKRSVAYNMPVAVRIEGDINSELLQSCIRELIKRHAVLRTTFYQKEDRVYGRVHNEMSFTLHSTVCSEEKLAERLKALVQPFDPGAGPLFNIQLLSISWNIHVLFIDFHHMIADGVSTHLFVTELFDLYAGRSLPALRAQFADHCWYQQELVSTNSLANQQQYWAQQLSKALPVLEMPADYERPVIFNTSGEKLFFEIDKTLLSQLKQLANSQQCTLHTVLLSLYALLLSKYTNQADIIIGIPVAGRKHADMQKVMGMFVNALPIYNHIEEDKSFIELLQRTKQVMIEALKHQDYPFEAIKASLKTVRQIGRQPVFDTMFIYQNMGPLPSVNNELTLSWQLFDPGFAKYDISMEVIDEDYRLRLGIEYSHGLFQRNTIGRLIQHFNTLVQRIIQQPNQKINTLHLLTDEAWQQYVVQFNNTESHFPANKTIHALFEEQVTRTPLADAIEYNGDRMSYTELNSRANALASLLTERGVGVGSIVGILVKRSARLLVSILGALKAGACYLPIDTELPVNRIQFLLQDSRCKMLVLGQDEYANHLPASFLGIDLFNIDTFDQQQATNLPPMNSAEDLAYVIYTSGTTGSPKGVMIEHRSLVNYITWAAATYVRQEKAAFPLYTSVSFDLTVTSIFTPLITGNRIVVYEETDKQLLIEKIIAEDKVEVVKLTPSHLRLLAGSGFPGAKRPKNIKRFIVGGEAFPARVASDIYTLFNGEIELFNEYGPTEATVGCMVYQFDPENSWPTVPLGIPAANTRIYILDSLLQPVPPGVPGEIYISGQAVARGYLYNDELTPQRFIKDPFINEARMYKTGDIARRYPDGTILYAGRHDQQVKINGYRIEPAEIERCMEQYDGIKEAVVTIKWNEDRKDLCAYYVAHNNKTAIEVAGLKGFLATKLPYYMIPVYVKALEKMPLNENGKIDYRALPEPSKQLEKKELLPRNNIEVLIQDVWRKVLKVDHIHSYDNFFELGGDSIKAVQISSLLFDKGLSLPVKSILTYHTIGNILDLGVIDTAAINDDETPVQGDKPLTPIEGWFFSRQFSNPSFYNQSVLLQINGEIDAEVLGMSFKKLVAHHDGLRLNYEADRNVLFYNNKHITADVLDLVETGPGKKIHTLEDACLAIKTGFDIASGLLLKAAMVRQDHRQWLFITAHHLVIDGISWRILLQDLVTIYKALTAAERVVLPHKTASLAAWQQTLTNYAAAALQTENEYWREIINTPFQIPLDFETNEWTARNTTKVVGDIAPKLTAGLLKGAHTAYRTDLLTLLLTALTQTLAEWTGQQEVIVEIENHGRHLDIDVSRTIGWFTVMHPVKLTLKEGTLAQQIKWITGQLKAVPNYGIGYGFCANLAGSIADARSSPSPIRFNYLGQFDDEFDNPLFTYIPAAIAIDTAPDNQMTAMLEINTMIIQGRLTLTITYNNKAHRASTIASLRDTLLRNLEQIGAEMENDKNGHYTPADFGLTTLNQEELDSLFE